MRKSPSTFDRAALLKGGGTVALASLLGGAKAKPHSGACCDPIDLSCESGSGRAKKSHAGAPALLGGVHLRARKPNEGTQPLIAGWTGIGLIMAAELKGNNGMGGQGNGKPLGYDVWVYTK